METIEKRNVLALKGKYGKDCIIYTEDVEEDAVNMVGHLLGNPLFKDTKIRVMPDVHLGKGIVIGFTCPVTSFINPQHVGLDIGCGIDLELFDRRKKTMPFLSIGLRRRFLPDSTLIRNVSLR